MIDSELLNTLLDLMLESIETSGNMKDKDNVMYFTWIYDELAELPQLKNAQKYMKETKRKMVGRSNLTEDELKMLHYLDSMIKATERNKKVNPDKLSKKQRDARDIIKDEAKRIKDDIRKFDIQDNHMSLDEIREYLMDDPELTDEERFELYYQEHQRVQEEKAAKKNMSFDAMLKKFGIEKSDSRKNK